MNDLPLLSIGLPVFNGENYIAETIESLLNQTFEDFELIIADNASTDSTLTICKRYASLDSRIKLLKSDVNKGAAWNFNRTVTESSSKYFKWAAHDDLHAPEFLRECIDVLEHDQSIVLAFSRTEFIDTNGDNLGEYKYPADLTTSSRRDIFLKYTYGNHIVHEIFGVIRRNALEKTPLIGGYVGSDLILLGRLALVGEFAQVPRVLFFHREHAGRSTVATGGDQGFTNWFDTAKSGRFAMPRLRILAESIRSIAVQPMGFFDRFGYLYDVGRAVNWRKKQYAEEFVQVFRRSTS